MVVNFNLMYDNGKEEMFVCEVSQEQLQEIVDVANEEFISGCGGVLRFNDGDVGTLVNVSKVTKLSFSIINNDPLSWN